MTLVSKSPAIALQSEASAKVAPRSAAVTATVIGNALEWFDFASYAFLAPVIAQHFFPEGDEVATLLSAFAVFGVGFVTRPLGAVFFGWLGDVYGRKLGLIISLPLMGLGTLIVGAAPSYVSIGYAASVLLVVARLLQGFAAGGENGSAMTFLVEWAPARQRGFYSSLQQCSTLLGTLLGSACAALLTANLSADALSQWGWRVPFLAGGLLIAPFGLLLRRQVGETPAFKNDVIGRSMAPPLTSPWLAGAKSIALSVTWVVSFYLYLVYLPSFLPRFSGLSPAITLWANTAGLTIMMCSIPLAGTLSDRFGRRTPLLVASWLSLIIPYPIFLALTHLPSEALLFATVMGAGAILGIFAGVIPATMSEMFSTSVRTSGLSISYGLATSVFGGFAPFVSTWMVKFTSSPISPAILLVMAGAVSVIATATLKETAFRDLPP